MPTFRMNFSSKKKLFYWPGARNIFNDKRLGKHHLFNLKTHFVSHDIHKLKLAMNTSEINTLSSKHYQTMLNLTEVNVGYSTKPNFGHSNSQLIQNMNK